MQEARAIYIKSAQDIAHQRLGDAREDNNFGGSLLAETALDATEKFFTQLQQSQSGDLEKALADWKQLLDEVLSEYRWERELLKHDLMIGEFRPRTFFSVLPEPHRWEHITSPPTELSEQTEARLLRIPPSQVGGTKLSVLVPICNGYRRTFRALACVALDIRSSKKLENYQVTFHVCINYTDDNSLYEVSRFANSMARAHGIGLDLYWLENPTARGTQGSPGMMRTNALNLILGQIGKERQKGGSKHFLHFCDDDIFIPPDQRILEKNIQQLEENSQLKIICGTYTNDDNHGFSAISSVRKRREFVSFDGKQEDPRGRLLNMYGGCMTTTLKRLSEVLPRRSEKGALYIPVLNSDQKQFGADPYLTIRANKEVLQEFANAYGVEGQGKTVQEKTKLADEALLRSPAYATRRHCIGHPEETNVIAFAKRYWRDLFWGERIIREHDIGVNPQLWEAYRYLRRYSFDPIKEKIEQNGSFRNRLAHAWLTAIRDKIKEWKQNEAKRPEWLRGRVSQKMLPPRHATASTGVRTRLSIRFARTSCKTRLFFEKWRRPSAKAAWGRRLLS